MTLLRRGQLNGVLLALLIGAVQSACNPHSPDAQKINHPPLIKSITLGPVPFDLRSDLTAQVETEDPDNDVVQVRYHWFLNDHPIGSDQTPVLSASLLKRGDRVRLEAVPFDGTVSGTIVRSELIEVRNTPPSIAQIGIGLKPSEHGDALHALVDATDRDHDSAQLLYRWHRNGRVIKEGEESFLDLTEVHSRDEIVLEVVPKDEQSSGKAVRSDPYVVGNRSPRIVSLPPAPHTRDRYEYMVTATDPEGDPIVYDLETGPPAMTINKTTGQLLWNMTPVPGGRYRVKVVVTDGQGGTAFQEFDLTVPS